MIATVDLYEITTDAMIKYNRYGRKIKFYYVVKIASLVKYFTTESGAHSFLVKKGFTINSDFRTYSLSYKSDEEVFLEKHYKKVKI